MVGLRLQCGQLPRQAGEVAGRVPGNLLRILRSHLQQPNPLPENRGVSPGHTPARARLSTTPARASPSPSPRVGWSVCPTHWRECSGVRTPVPPALFSGFGPALGRSSAEPLPPPGPLCASLILYRSGGGLCCLIGLLPDCLRRFSLVWGCLEGLWDPFG